MQCLRCFVKNKENECQIKVRSILESLQFINQHHASVARFGDGEIDIIQGHSIPYQVYNEGLSRQLKKILQTPSSEKLLVCLPDVFEHLERYNDNAKLFWNSHFKKYHTFYEKECQSKWYGSTFLSRPYIDLVDKTASDVYFVEIKKIWQDRNILIVEGENSRSGVGNDLFDNAQSVKRIICPSKNAFDYYDEILETIKKYAEHRLILLMLGPTAKVLSYELANQGHQAIDLGHIDSEYEWYGMQATHKVKLLHKHTAEFNWDEQIENCVDKVYYQQILATVGIEMEIKEKQMNQAELISVIVPVYNVERYLERCLNSILKQTYTRFELLLINDGSTDNSAQICEDYAKKDSRIRVIHQENAGPSAARNKGIELSRGDYITFIDSDDFVEDYYLQNLYTALIKNDADISVCNFNSFNEERQSFLFSITSDKYFEKVYEVEEWLNQENTAQNNLYLVFTFSPLKLFKKELFSGIYFPNGRLREDDATIYKLYLKANKIAFINQGSYYYSQRREGLSRNGGMLDDITSMISNAEERMALLVTLGYDVEQHIDAYIKRLRKCHADALRAGQIELYQHLTTKLDLITYHRKG